MPSAHQNGSTGGLLESMTVAENGTAGGVTSSTPWRLDVESATGLGLPGKSKTLRWLKQLLIPKIGGGGAPERLRPTAYLDGLRGFAAFMVYWHHHELWPKDANTFVRNAILENGFGYNNERHFATFPGFRNIFTCGHMAVATFYVISGYVLSLKPMSLIHKQEYDKVSENLASALFRRWLRLYLPLIVTTFIYVTMWHLFGIWTSNTVAKSTYGEEVWNWYLEFKNFSFVFRVGGEPWVTYNQHLWSIPLEMKGSIIIYTTLLAVSRIRPTARLLVQAFLIYYFMYIVDGYYGSLFVMGMLLCDLDMLAARDDENFPSFFKKLEPAKTFIFYHLFFFALFLAGAPSHDQKMETWRATPIWSTLSWFKPQAVYDPKWFYLFFAATFLVVSIPRIGWLKRFFETRFCQYLGRISFSLYLVHGPVLATVGDRVYHMVGWVRPFPKDQEVLNFWTNWFPLPKTGPLGLELSFLVPHIFLLPFTLWVADVVTRGVDEPSVRVAQWLYKKALGDGPPPRPSADPQRLA